MSTSPPPPLEVHLPLSSRSQFVHWRCWQDQYRDVTAIEGLGRYGDTWRIELDNLTFAGLGFDQKRMLAAAMQAAESGMSPDGFATILYRKLNAQQMNSQQQSARQQQLQNQLGGQGYGSQQHMNQQQSQMQALGWGGNSPLRSEPVEPPKPKLWEKPEKLEQEIIAYRAWLLDWECAGWSGEGSNELPILRPVLHSINQQFTWDGPVARSTTPPAANSKAGLYAVGVEDRFGDNFRSYVTSGNVWGEVALSGIVVEGDCGYRAEVTTIRRLWIGGGMRINVYIDSPARLAQLLADRYQCDVATTPVQPTLEAAQAFFLDAIKKGV